MKPENSNHRICIEYLHLFVLSGFALAQPLFDLLGRYADFFVAHGAGSTAVLLLVAATLLVVPVFLSALEAITGLISGSRIRQYVHLGFSGILTVLIVLPPLNRWGALPDFLVYLVALMAGGAFVFIYSRYKITRSFLTYLSPAILIFPIYFLLFTPVKSIVFHKKSDRLSEIKIGNKVPVILIVFDEFNTMALFGRDGKIDSVRFPNFLKFSRESWWFPNATCASLETTKSIPAILTGMRPLKHKLATSSDHPHNLFMLLAGRYYINVLESETSLCPDSLKNNAKIFDFSSFSSDIGMLYRALVVPGALTRLSGNFEGRWKGFSPAIVSGEDKSPTGILLRNSQIDRFLRGIRPGKRNQLDFMHITLPHVPYEYLSSGKSYNNPDIFPDGILRDEAGWGSSVELVEVAYQRYLQQAGYTDRLLGRIIDSLKARKIYDRSLVIITADHGVSMQPERSRRGYAKGDPRELVKVPTFIKMPGQQQAEVCEDLVSGMDILPTIAGVLLIELPWKPDGRPMVPGMTWAGSMTARQKVEIPGSGIFTRKELEGFPLLVWKDSVFGTGTPLSGLIRKDVNRTLPGMEIKKTDTRPVRLPFIAEIGDIDQFLYVDLAGGYLPALVRGHLAGSVPDGKQELAIAVNGKISATTATTKWQDQKAFFTALLSETAFQQGRNNLEVYLIRRDPVSKNQFLVKIPLANQENIILVTGKNGGVSLRFDDGREIPVKPLQAKGFLDGFHLNENTVTLTAWAYDKQAGSPAQSIIIFSGSQFLTRVKTGDDRKDIIPYLKTDKARYCGIHTEIPKYAFNGEKVKAFGITGNGEAFELRLTDNVSESIKKYFQKQP